MAQRVCPWWIGYLLISPLRRLVENPGKILGPHVRPGMRVLEPGCAMGYFTLPLARLVGPKGKVVAVDLQAKMLKTLAARAAKKGLAARIETRLAPEAGLNLTDLHESMDFAAAIHLVHEVPDHAEFFREMWRCLRPGGRLLFIEPKGHVSPDEFAASLDRALDSGFGLALPLEAKARRALLQKPKQAA